MRSREDGEGRADRDEESVDDGRDTVDDLHSQAPGVAATSRARTKSASLWGIVGSLTFLVLAQGYVLLGGTLPFRHVGLFPIAVVVGVVVGVVSYRLEHRLGAKRRV